MATELVPVVLGRSNVSPAAGLGETEYRTKKGQLLMYTVHYAVGIPVQRE